MLSDYLLFNIDMCGLGQRPFSVCGGEKVQCFSLSLSLSTAASGKTVQGSAGKEEGVIYKTLKIK